MQHVDEQTKDKHDPPLHMLSMWILWKWHIKI